MSIEAQLRALLVAHGPLVAVVPADRISIDVMDASARRPYVVFEKISDSPQFGLGSQVLGGTCTVAINVIGRSRADAIAVRELVQAALLAGRVPWTSVTAAYDEAIDAEGEIVTVDWLY